MNADEESVKRQARRRLIGAVALTTAVVIILPLVFDSEPPATVRNDIELRIPDKDKAEEFHAASATPVVSSSTPVVAAPASAIVAAPAPLTVAPVVVPQPPVQVQAGKISEAAKAEVKPEVKPKAEAKHEAHGVPHSGFAVQVAAFSNADSAKALQDKLGKQGLHAYTEKVGSHVRVRVGGFATREAADKVRHKLESQGLHPNVVNLGN